MILALAILAACAGWAAFLRATWVGAARAAEAAKLRDRADAAHRHADAHCKRADAAQAELAGIRRAFSERSKRAAATRKANRESARG